MDQKYTNQVKIILDVLPLLKFIPTFALKGGTSITLFYRNFERRSVDIDLCYLPIEDRKTTIENIFNNLLELKKLIEQKLSCTVDFQKTKSKDAAKLFVRAAQSFIKIEPNFIIRGSCFEPQKLRLNKKVADSFNVYVEALNLSFEDVYAGKLCAALDRQHPRDLFDIKLLLENEGLTDTLRKTFLVYLAQSNRPMSELLSPQIQNIKYIYEAEFKGMDDIGTKLSELEHIQHTLPKLILSSLTDNEKKFLISMKDAHPDWNLLGLKDFSQLPGIQWKLINIKKMEANKRKEALEKLKQVLV